MALKVAGTSSAHFFKTVPSKLFCDLTYRLPFMTFLPFKFMLTTGYPKRGSVVRRAVKKCRYARSRLKFEDLKTIFRQTF